MPWTAVAAFIALAYGFAWLVTMPLWVGDGLASPYVSLVLPAMMMTPVISALIVTFLVQRPKPTSISRFLGVSPLRPLKRLFGMLGVGFAVALVVPVLAIAVAAITGALHLDLVRFSGFQQAMTAQLEGTGVTSEALPIHLLVILQIASIPIGALTNSVLAAGEEIGWRGWLLSALRPLGTWPTLTITGLAWGLWHSPLILLGYNFDEPNPLGLLLMTLGCTATGIIFGWLRLRSGSVWPPVLAHGAFNSAAGLSLLVAASSPTPEPLALNPLSWPGWIACALVITTLLAFGQFKTRRLPATQT